MEVTAGEQQSADATPTPQMDLFAAPGTPPDDDDEANAGNGGAPAEQTAALEALAEIDPDSLSPRDALEALYRLKALAETAHKV